MKYFILFLLLSFKVNALTILIDPGHGGSDLGATTTYKKQTLYEKDIALSISTKIYEKLKSEHSVFLTRSVDRVVTLQERADLAQKLNADIFVSIHINSGGDNRSQGFETYYLDNHHDQAVKKVEKIENENLAGDALIVNQILIDLAIKLTVKDSKNLASLMHQNISKKVKTKYKLQDRGVKPGLFYVLALSKRPSVLLEVGFMSNSKDLEKLLSKDFQNDYAEAVVAALKNYIKSKATDKSLKLF